MNAEFKKIVKDLGYQLNITLLEEQLEDIMSAVVRKCAEYCEEQKLAPSIFTAEDLKKHFRVE